MTPRRAPLRRLALLLVFSLLAPLAITSTALAQTAATHAPSTQPGPSQASSSRSSPTPSPSGPAPTTAATPASAIAPNGPAATAPAAGQAAPAGNAREYEIEIVIFRANVALGQPEDWAAETTAGATVAGGEASSGSRTVGKLLEVLPRSDYLLTPIASQLRSSGTYTPVAHAAWVQTASDWGTRAGFSLESLGIDVPGLTGVVFLERGEFLHLGMTLDYTMQSPPPGLHAPSGTTFVMNETRRVRFYQRNYYDHPAFGVIALVTPAQGSRAPGR